MYRSNAKWSSLGFLILIYRTLADNILWAGSLQRVDGVHCCLANIIHEKHSVTAAKCVANFYSQDEPEFKGSPIQLISVDYMYVTLYDLSEKVDSFTNHPLAQMEELYNIAVITLKEPLKIDRKRQIMPLVSMNRTQFLSAAASFGYFMDKEVKATYFTYKPSDTTKTFNGKRIEDKKCDEIIANAKAQGNIQNLSVSSPESRNCTTSCNETSHYLCFQDDNTTAGLVKCPTDHGSVFISNSYAWALSYSNRDLCLPNSTIRLFYPFDLSLSFLSHFINEPIEEIIENSSADLSTCFIAVIFYCLMSVLVLNNYFC